MADTNQKASATDDQKSTLAQELEQYSNPRDKPTPSELHVPFVTPRAFASPIGFDIEAQPLNRRLASELIKREKTREMALIVWNPGAHDLEGNKRSAKYNDGKYSLRVWRVDAGGEHIVNSWANGGFIVRYHGCNTNADHVSDVHTDIGWFHIEHPDEMGKLFKRILSDDSQYTEYNWGVVEYDSDNTHRFSEILDEHLIDQNADGVRSLDAPCAETSYKDPVER